MPVKVSQIAHSAPASSFRALAFSLVCHSPQAPWAMSLTANSPRGGLLEAQRQSVVSQAIIRLTSGACFSLRFRALWEAVLAVGSTWHLSGAAQSPWTTKIRTRPNCSFSKCPRAPRWAHIKMGKIRVM